jgi:gas vesicle protein
MITESYPERRAGHSLTAFLLGAAVGAVAALLFAPASGAETRSKIRKLSKDAAREARRRFEQGRQRFAEAAEDVEASLDQELGSSSQNSPASSQEDKYDH